VIGIAQREVQLVQHHDTAAALASEPPITSSVSI
jgi:hypothetical protein